MNPEEQVKLLYEVDKWRESFKDGHKQLYDVVRWQESFKDVQTLEEDTTKKKLVEPLPLMALRHTLDTQFVGWFANPVGSQAVTQMTSQNSLTGP